MTSRPPLVLEAHWGIPCPHAARALRRGDDAAMTTAHLAFDERNHPDARQGVLVGEAFPRHAVRELLRRLRDRLAEMTQEEGHVGLHHLLSQRLQAPHGPTDGGAAGR